MSGFATTWLDLREPADHAGRDAALLKAAASVAVTRAGETPPTVLDLGCGTGSTVRALAPHLPAATNWLLFDNDRRLLDEAARRLADHRTVETIEGDLGQVAAVPFEKADLVTASALFDLVSAAWLETFVDRLAMTRTPIYAALSFDGTIVWKTAIEGDAAIVAAFDEHQQTDKGFGPALGPGAGAELAKLLTMRGWTVTTAASDWQLGRASEALEADFVRGIARAVRERKTILPTAVDRWENERLAYLGSGCRVGHIDVLASPRPSG